MRANRLNQHRIRLIAVFSLLAWLTACTTVQPPSPSAFPPNPAVGTAPADKPESLPATAVTSGDAGTRGDAAALIRQPAEQPRPALLADEAAREFQRGGASWYGPGFQGRRTASGERYDMNAMTAAHRTLPFGTMVRVHSLVNGRDVDVRITDRGPYGSDRVIDVSRAAAEQLGMLGQGFKEVVLLVPESTPDIAILPPASASKVKPRRKTKRAPKPKAR